MYFLSRPRRFGKSLLVTIFREIFQGNKELFQKLWIGQETDYAFEAFPILQFNFADYGRKIKNLEEILQHEITKYAQQFGIDIDEVSLGNRFKSLVSGIASKGKPVVILIDEYDKPIVDFILEKTDWNIYGLLRWSSKLDNIEHNLNLVNKNKRFFLLY